MDPWDCQVMVNTENNLQNRKPKTGWRDRDDFGGPLTKSGEKTGENFPFWERKVLQLYPLEKGLEEWMGNKSTEK